MILGAHESIAGGHHRALERAVLDRADAVQIFVKNARAWKARPIEPAEAAAFRAARKASGVKAVFAHASYLINLAAGPETEIRAKSIEALADELARCELLGIEGLVVHPGASADRERGIARIADAVREALERAPGRAAVWLENTAGQGASIGADFDELGRLLDGIDSDRLGVCFDTCHAFAAGNDLRDEAGYRRTFRRLGEAIGGLSRVKAFHLNDCKKPLGCRVDRHEDPGDGTLGLGPFARLLGDRRFARVPGVLETPVPERYGALLERLRTLAGS